MWTFEFNHCNRGSSGATTIPGDLGSGYVSDHDNNFVTGDSPVEYDFVSLMGRKAKVISMLNFGSSDLTLAVNEGMSMAMKSLFL